MPEATGTVSALNPERCCDLVMKGGITSGIVYPSAVYEIAERFHLIGIAGSSAGAMAACLVAAAEYRRRTHETFDGYERLREVADEFKEPGRLLSLFQPDHSTRRLFNVGMDALKGKGGGKLRLINKLLWPGCRERLFTTLTDNGYGLCSGMAHENRSDGPDPLTLWLHKTIQSIAQLPVNRPLTFKDLHNAPVPAVMEQLTGARPDRSIDFRTITTCVTFGRPLEFPFRENIFAFDEVEWRRLFPDAVYEHVVRAGREIESKRLRRNGKLPLPSLDLPIVVAARMSLSFPVLFSMVPLWAVDYHQQEAPLKRVWFSDGGITSNFPIHRFDALYPRWPTIGINLKYTGKDGQPQRSQLRRNGQFVYLPDSPQDGVLDLWELFDDEKSSAGKLFGFASSLFSSAQNWHDNAYMKLPGYRDRAVEIWLKPDEGGFNLDMGDEAISRLLRLGRDAGKFAVSRFADAAQTERMSWSGHRWTRFRSSMAGLLESVRRFADAASTHMVPDDPTLFDMLDKVESAPLHPFKSAQRKEAVDAVNMLIEFANYLASRDIAGSVPAPLDSPFHAGPMPRVTNGSRAPI